MALGLMCISMCQTIMFYLSFVVGQPLKYNKCIGTESVSCLVLVQFQGHNIVYSNNLVERLLLVDKREISVVILSVVDGPYRGLEVSVILCSVFQEFIAARRMIVLKYPRFYTMLDTVSLSPPRVNQNICLQHLQTLLEMVILHTCRHNYLCIRFQDLDVK